MIFPELAAPRYEAHNPIATDESESGFSEATTKFYVEQGAAPDTIVEPLYWFDHDSIRRYGEVGCGFGFGLDFAREALGWEVIGYDPSPLAQAGRRALNLPIRLEYLGPDTWCETQPLDVLLASEVIEHIADPHQFLDHISPALAPDGWLVLSTPNAAGVNQAATLGNLLPILTPGYHLVLFTEEGLHRLLEAHGFTQIDIRATSTNLTVLANRRPRSCDLTRTLDRRRYREYLDARLRDLDPNTPVAHGFVGRLIKELTNAGELDGAEAEIVEIGRRYRKSYGIDLDAPETILCKPIETHDFSTFSAALPANLCGLAYRRGFIRLHRDQDPIGALPFFHLGERAGSVLRKALQTIGSDDGETEHLVGLCRLAAHDTIRTIERRYCTLAIQGDYHAAHALDQSRESVTTESIEASGFDAAERARCYLARGLVALNHLADPPRSLKWFQAARATLSQLPVSEQHGEETLACQIETGLLLSMASVEPLEAAQECLRRLECEKPSTRDAKALCREVFQRQIHAGAYAAAALLEEIILADLSAIPQALTPELAFTLGVLSLNHKQEPLRASDWFVQAATLSPTGSPLTDIARGHAAQAEALAEKQRAALDSAR
ncbi:class I SAM-dependent methyltransferase [Thiohalocapsa marina]|uniref:class I SAM-dependent methyltransferase n=1 Tax=Thiohalocapsa marina TaxID=424902 RepID=UPI0036D91C52